jgi:hypothetical protein
MRPVSFKRHRFPDEVTRHAVWLYFRFTLSVRDVEEMLAERGIDISYETTRYWALKFGRLFAQNLRRSTPRPTGRWHLDEMVVKINGQRMWLWPSDSCPSTQPPTIPSTFSATSSPPARTELFEPRPCRRGVRSPQRLEPSELTVCCVCRSST